VIYLN